jgi:hypothetical protein
MKYYIQGTVPCWSQRGGEFAVRAQLGRAADPLHDAGSTAGAFAELR